MASSADIDFLTAGQRQVLVALKQSGEASTDGLAAVLDITASAVRQHLTALRSGRFVESRQERGRPGRPVEMYHCTELAELAAPDFAPQLVLELLEQLDTDHPDFISRFFEKRRDRRVEDAEKQLGGKDLPARVAGLAEILDDAGYLSSWEDLGDGGYRIVLHNCPIWRLATCRPQVCSAELEVMREVLAEANVERLDHKLVGAQTCSYQIELASQSDVAVDVHVS